MEYDLEEITSRIRSYGIRSKGIRSNVINVPQKDISLFKKNKTNDQNQLLLEINQDQSIHLNALKAKMKMSRYYKLECDLMEKI